MRKPHLNVWRYGFLFFLTIRQLPLGPMDIARSAVSIPAYTAHARRCRHFLRFAGGGGLFPLLRIQRVQSRAQRLHAWSYRVGGRSTRSRLHHVWQGGDRRHKRPLRLVVVVAGHVRRGMANNRLHDSQRDTGMHNASEIAGSFSRFPSFVSYAQAKDLARKSCAPSQKSSGFKEMSTLGHRAAYSSIHTGHLPLKSVGCLSASGTASFALFSSSSIFLEVSTGSAFFALFFLHFFVIAITPPPFSRAASPSPRT